MTMEAMLQHGIATLEQAEVMNAELDARYLLEHILQIRRVDFLLDRQREVSTEQQEAYMHKINLRATHVPLQHILGNQEFMGYEFLVNEHVLIPRQDTEVLVETALPVVEGKRVLDLCTGSGCIIISLSKMGDLQQAVGVDLSEEALSVAKENAKRLEADVTFLHSDLFEQVTGVYDVIVSNPPYIETETIAGLMEEVRDHEPRMALDGGRDGLDFYRRIVQDSVSYLAADGYLCFEIGCEQGQAVRALLEEQGFTECRIVKDLAGLDRVVYGRWSVEHG